MAWKIINNCDPYNALLSIATNIAVLLMTAFVLQGHIYGSKLTLISLKIILHVEIWQLLFMPVSKLCILY